MAVRPERPRWGRVPFDPASRAPWRRAPFDDAEYEDRWARVGAWLAGEGLDALVAVASPGDSAMTRWLANYESYVGQTAVVVTARGAAAVATNSLMRAEPMHSGVWMSPVADVRPAGNRRYMPDAKTLEQLVGEILADHAPGRPRLALAGPVTAAMQRAFPEAADATAALAGLMAVKSPAEVALLRRCNAAGDAMLEAAMAGLRPGVSEHELAGDVFRAMMAAGAEGPAVPLALVGGPRSGLKHVGPTEYRLRVGDLFFVDVGPFVEGYACDISRSGVVGGRPDAEQRRFLDCGVAMTAAAVAAAGPGVPQKALDDAAFAVACEFGLAEDYYFRAHGVGTALFLPPRFNPGDATPLRPGEVFSLEPMLVRLGYGCACVERTVLVTETGVELLDSQAPRWWGD
jgi:Xaa-Pro aminopeptidase